MGRIRRGVGSRVCGERTSDRWCTPGMRIVVTSWTRTGGQRRRQGVLAAVTTVLVASATVWGLWGIGPLGLASAAARSCPSADLLAVRGSGQHTGFGQPLDTLRRKLRKLDPSAHADAIDYPAIDVNPLNPGYNTEYEQSVIAGAQALRATIARDIHSYCGARTQLVLSGYSQGAEVVDDVFQNLLTEKQKARIKGVVLFGDPRFNPAQTLPVDVGTFNHSLVGVAPYQFHPPTGTFGTLVSYSTFEAPLVRSYCANHDQICNYSSPAALAGCTINCAHYHYMDLKVSVSGRSMTYTDAAASFLNAHLGETASPVNECGDINSGLHNLISRNVTCGAARRFVLGYERCHGSSCVLFQGYRCSYRSVVAGVSDEFRCVSAAQVISWRVGP